MAIHRPQKTSQMTFRRALSMAPFHYGTRRAGSLLRGDDGPGAGARWCWQPASRQEHLMESGDYDPPLAPGLLIAQSWQVTVILGAVTLILGLIVSFHPGGSLNVVAVLLGIALICSGIFHLVRIFGRGEAHRVWLGISGLLLIVIGVVLIRHLPLTLALVGACRGRPWV